MQKVRSLFLTGACGFIGSHLLSALIRKGFEVAILKHPKTDIWRVNKLLPKVKIYEADLKETPKIIKAVSDFRPQAIIHLAAHYKLNHTSSDILKLFQANNLGAANMLEAAKEAGTNLFINTSSFFVYKNSTQSFKEESKLKPFNLYSLTKIFAEQLCSFYAQEYGIKCVTFRIFPPYGPADNQRRLIPYLINSFIKGEPPKMTKGEQEWDFIYVGDIVEAYLKAITVLESESGHEIFNLGNSKTVKIKEIAGKIKQILNSDLEPLYGAIDERKNELMHVCADIDKTRSRLSWEPKVDLLREGLDLTVNWYKENEHNGH